MGSYSLGRGCDRYHLFLGGVGQPMWIGVSQLLEQYARSYHPRRCVLPQAGGSDFEQVNRRMSQLCLHQKGSHTPQLYEMGVLEGRMLVSR